ncbi:hypothetical protein DL764_003978 [Monosporascus ibericus]|uniref:VWFA domain-containing protein n=1 Tax=Monosporascus ibericus TaxID=155417 RepID=A0A4Q4TF51_9PEZI|nr:hypothetical protein DL764_003978 [Monosporascus ibericus]
MSCRSCDMRALGCSSRGTPNHHHVGLAAQCKCQLSLCHVDINNSLATGNLSHFTPCLISAAIEKVALDTRRNIAPTILPALEKILQEDEKLKQEALRKAEEAACERARLISIEAAKITAKEVATAVAQMVAPDAAAPPARETAERIARELTLSLVREVNAKQRMNEFATSQLPWLALAVMDRFGIATREEAAAQVPQLALYDFILVCGVSSMMELPRIPTLEATVTRLYRILRDLGSERSFSIIPFKGETYEDLKSDADVRGALDSLNYNTGASTARPLRNIVIPLLEEEAVNGTLRPTVVVVITDANVSGVREFGDQIGNFKDMLESKGNNGPAVLLLICRVGDDQNEKAKLRKLKENDNIRKMLLYSEDQLDSRLAELQHDIVKYTRWVVGELLKAMELQLMKR